MPEMDGIAFLDRIGNGALPGFPIIMLTRFGEEGKAALAIQRGAQDFLVKGETTPELLTRSIEHARERFRISRELADSHARLIESNRRLQENVERLHAIFSQSTVGIAQTDLDGRFTLINDAFCVLAGRTRDQLLRIHLQELTTALPDPLWDNSEAERLYFRPDQSTIWVYQSVSVIRGVDGEPVGTAILAGDITERKAAKDAQSLLASIVQASSDAIVFQDVQGVIRTWNLGAEQTYGYAAQEVVGKQFEILLPEDKLNELALRREAAALGNLVQGSETTRVCKAGHLIPVAETFSVRAKFSWRGNRFLQHQLQYLQTETRRRGAEEERSPLPPASQCDASNCVFQPSVG